MRDKLVLGIPNDSEANAPKKRFEFKDTRSRAHSVVIPFFVAAWAMLLKQFLTEEKPNTHAPPHHPDERSATPTQDPGPALSDDPQTTGSTGHGNLVKVLGGSSVPYSERVGSSIEPSDLQLVKTPLPNLSFDPAPLAQGNQPQPVAMPRNDNLSLRAGASGGGGGGGGDGDGSGETRPGRSGRPTTGDNPTTSHPHNPGVPGNENAAGNPHGGGNTGVTGGSNGNGIGAGNGGGAPAAPANRRPIVTGPVYLESGLINESIIITVGALLANASDPDGDRLTVVSLQADSGSLQQLDPERWLYTPTQDDGAATFRYAVSDGKVTVAETAFAEFVSPRGEQIEGTDGDDGLVGTPRNDVIVAHAGNDIVYGREGHDVIEGGAGNDRLVGGDGDDVMFGGAGNDILFGGTGNDTMFGGDGNDVLHGDSGNDVIFGDAGDDSAYGDDGNDIIDGGTGNDLLSGGPDADTIDGGEGDDQLAGDDGDDRLFGSDGNDSIVGGKGDDRLYGGAGSDHLEGGEGNDFLDAGTGNNEARGGRGDDVFALRPGSRCDMFEGGDGNDTLDLSDLVFDSTVDIPDGIVIIDGIASASIFEIENVRGGSGRDRLIADQHTNIMVGGAGDDTFVFGSEAALANNGGPRDHIMDFSLGDRLDLSRISLDPDDFAGKKLFFAGAASASFQDIGAVSYHFETAPDGHEVTVVTANLNADQASECEIVLDGRHDLTQADFILAAKVHDGEQPHA